MWIRIQVNILLAALLVGKRLNIRPEVVPNASVCKTSPSTEMQCFPTESWIEKSRLDFLNTSQPTNIPLSSENMTQG